MKSEKAVTNKTVIKKRITLDDLAAMLKRQFDSIDARFDNMDEKMETVATKDDIRRLELRFEKIEDIVLNDHRLRIQALEKEIGIW